MLCFKVKGLDHPQKRIKCALNDYFAFRMPVPVAFFYRTPIPSDLIIKALQHVLKDFPIFAGTLVKEHDHLYIDCNNQGVQVKSVHSQHSLSEQLSNFQKLDSTIFVDMLNPYATLKRRTALLTIKLSYFSDGMALGFCWHHSVGDMATFMEFLRALSTFAQGKSYPLVNIVEDRGNFLRENIKTHKIEGHSDLKRLGFSDVIRFIKQILAPKRSIHFYFPKEEIEALRLAISTQAGHKLSRNSVLCAHVLECIGRCRNDNSALHYASIIVNCRSRIGLSSNAMGNFIDVVSLKSSKTSSTKSLALSIHDAVSNYLHLPPEEIEAFVQKNGGIKNIGKLIPYFLLPQYKNLIITNWSNYAVYSIDFGISAPFLFLPVGRAPIPWVSCIVEGFENNGLLLSMVLPTKVAKRLTHPEMLSRLHQYRPHSLQEPSCSKGFF